MLSLYRELLLRAIASAVPLYAICSSVARDLAAVATYPGSRSKRYLVMFLDCGFNRSLTLLSICHRPSVNACAPLPTWLLVSTEE